MKLAEKIILSPDVYSEYTKLDGKKKSDFLSSALQDIFSADPDYNAYKDVLQDSVDSDGLDTVTNKFLTYLINKKNVSYNLTPNKANLLYHLIRNEETAVASPAKNFWLYNPEAYNGSELKIKALAFLGSSKSANYGNPKTKPTKQILQSTNDTEIQTLLSDWQTKDPNEEDENSSKKKSDKMSKSDFLKMKSDLISELSKVLRISEQEISVIVQQVAKNSDTKDKLLSKVMKRLGVNATTAEQS